MYQPVDPKVSFPKMEEAVLKFWEENSIFEASLKNRADAEKFIFYDGPPFATGKPHYGHLLAGTIKDVVPRFQTMRGKYVERVFGWDCHGLPIEALAQEALNLKGTAAVFEAGVDRFNDQCRSMVSTYVDEWEKTVTRMGRWVDLKNGYKTMDKNFMESVWWVFKQLYDQGRIYKSYRIMPYSWKLTTPLSNFEAGSNYKMVQDPSVTVKVRILDAVPGLNASTPVYALLWTTTPWTLPSNLALCVGPEIDYVAAEDTESGEIYLMAKARLNAYYRSESEYRIAAEYKGGDLTGLHYEPLFPYFADTPNAFVILQDGYVSTEDGTGIVHIAPAYGEDDFRVCKAAGIGIVDPLDDSCRFTDRVPEYSGQFCKDADSAIIRRLKDERKLIRRETVTHSYPFCDRTDTPLIYRAIEAWYVRIEDVRDRFCACNDTVKWIPEYVGAKRFGNWLKEAKDWNISRNRFWGSCIPIWINEADSEDRICIGSVAELENLSGQKVEDLHKHVIDRIVIQKDGKTYRRTPEVLDCWFESGSMPYAQHHYPFEKKGREAEFFPADFIAEGLDQTRGWFYTLMVLGTLLFNQSPYRNVVVNGLILAEDGMKMSKRKKNYPDPSEIIDGYGADALRFYLMSSPVVRAENLKFSKDGVCEVLRNVILPLWNAYSFFVTYANIDSAEAKLIEESPRNPLDRWILSEAERMNASVIDNMEKYELSKACEPILKFLDLLNNWYIRRSRRRFWKSENDRDKEQAYDTLYTVLMKLIKTAAPFIPFVTEAIYRNLRTDSMPESVHLCDYPEPDKNRRDPALEQKMEVTRHAVVMGRALRAAHSLKTRLPLKEMHIVTRDREERNILRQMEDFIKEELNVKSIVFKDNEDALVEYSAKADFKKLGSRLGKSMKAAADQISRLTGSEIQSLIDGAVLSIDVDGFGPLDLNLDSIIVQRREKDNLKILNEDSLTVAFDTQITEDLKNEGLARDFIRAVQNLRKESGFEVSDRIRTGWSGPSEIRAAVEAFEDRIAEETLSVALFFEERLQGTSVKIGDSDCVLRLEKV